MDPSFWGSLFKNGADVLKTVGTSGPADRPAGPQRADGYAMGGMLTSPSSNAFSSGATGGAYGGAWSQANIDGSNWVVATGNGRAVGGGTSGGNGGLSPTQTNSQSGMTPSNPFSVGPVMPGQGNGTLLLLGAAALVYFIVGR
jgi:hypothetical protein